MKSIRITGIILMTVSVLMLSSCGGKNYNKKLMGGSADSLYTPALSTDTSIIRDTIIPGSVDSTGAQSGKMTDPNKDSTVTKVKITNVNKDSTVIKK